MSAEVNKRMGTRFMSGWQTVVLTSLYEVLELPDFVLKIHYANRTSE